MEALRGFPHAGGACMAIHFFAALVSEARPCSLMGLSLGLCRVDKPCLKPQSTTQRVFLEPSESDGCWAEAPNRPGGR
jgi:hypothetical protein